jgi:dihydrofolate reductase
MNISLVAAVSANGVIGINNHLPWHFSADLKRFKELTMGKPVVMGRKTYESLPKKPLPGRMNFVLSSQRQPVIPNDDGPFYVNDLKELKQGIEWQSEVIVAGGAQIYKLLMPYAYRMFITHINDSYPGDVVFPAFDPGDWYKDTYMEGEEAGIKFSYAVYRRLRNMQHLCP